MWQLRRITTQVSSKCAVGGISLATIKLLSVGHLKDVIRSPITSSGISSFRAQQRWMLTTDLSVLQSRRTFSSDSTAVADEDDLIEGDLEYTSDVSDASNKSDQLCGIDHSDASSVASSLPSTTLVKPTRTAIFTRKVKKKLINKKIQQKIAIVIKDDDLEEKFVRGSGPGGQSVNKSNNCVQLLHTPTGIFISCHEARDLTNNRKIARKRLEEKLDLLWNGNNSKLGQKIQKIRKRKKKAESRSKKKYENVRDRKEADE